MFTAHTCATRLALLSVLVGIALLLALVSWDGIGADSRFVSLLALGLMLRAAHEYLRPRRRA